MLAAEHAALAEERLLATMVAGSTMITTGQVLGTARDVVTVLDRVCGIFRSRHRLEATTSMTCIVPAYLKNMMRSDLARELPGASTERLAVTDTEIAKMFAVRNVTPVYSLDYQRNDNVQGANGPALGWPSIVDALIFATGSWLFLDGGELSLGVFRDMALVATNDARIFAETFENVAFVGSPRESLRVRMDVCDNGATATALDIAPCITGS